MTTKVSSDPSNHTENENVAQAMADVHLHSTPVPLPSSLPSTLSRSYNILGIPTDMFVQIFQDRIVVGISQRQQKIGTWCYCQASQSQVDPQQCDWNISTVLGDRSDNRIGVYARNIATGIVQNRWISGSTTMVIFLGLSLQFSSTQKQETDNTESKNDVDEIELFHTIVSVALNLIQEALEQMRS